MRRRDFITGLAGAAMSPRASSAQQALLPVIGFVNGGSADGYAPWLARFIKGLNETGLVEGGDFTIEHHWLEGQYDGLPALMTDLAHRRVAVIAIPGFSVATFAAKAATPTIPIVFGVAEDPVKLGLVDSLARPGGNATGINYFQSEAVAKRLGLLHALVPKAVRVAALVNPGSATTTEATLQALRRTGATNGLQIQVLKATTSREIDAAFDRFGPERPDAIFVAPDQFFGSRRVQLATLAARERIPVAYGDRIYVEAGGLMSYGAGGAEMFHQVGLYTGRILKGAKPADLPVLQSTKFEFVINLQTARALGIEVSPGLLAIVDEVID